MERGLKFSLSRLKFSDVYKRQFYQSVTLMNLKPLDVEKYKEFATAKFEERNKHLDTAIIGFNGCGMFEVKTLDVILTECPNLRILGYSG